jgi:hypothetical protein
MKHTIAIVITCTLVVLCICGFSFWIFHSSNTQTPSDQVPQQGNAPQQIETNYYMATIPVGFSITSNVETSNALERLKITAENPKTNIKIEITVGDTPNGGLGNLISYKTRINDPDTYTRQSFGGMPVDAITFHSSTKERYELTAFRTNGSLYSVITISGPANQQGQINIIMESFLDQWQWR